MLFVYYDNAFKARMEDAIGDRRVVAGAGTRPHEVTNSRDRIGRLQVWPRQQEGPDVGSGLI